jgi:hypothetical protein
MSAKTTESTHPTQTPFFVLVTLNWSKSGESMPMVWTFLLIQLPMLESMRCAASGAWGIGSDSRVCFKLPDLKLGTANAASCDPRLADTLLGTATSATGYSGVLNGRFKGGHITREYGNPARDIHAVQPEMTQSSYMGEALPFDCLPSAGAAVGLHLRCMLEAALAFVG